MKGISVIFPKVICILWGLFVIVVPFLYRMYYDTNMLAYASAITTVGILIAMIAVRIAGSVKCVIPKTEVTDKHSRKDHIRLTYTDLFVLLYLVYTSTTQFLRGQSMDNANIAEWISLVAIYCIARLCNYKCKRALLGCIVITGMIQAFFGIMQHLGMLSPYHPDFIVTGSLLNPGPYGGFIAVTFVSAAISTLREFKIFKVSKPKSTTGKTYTVRLIVLVSIVLLIGYALCLSDSRAAWLAAAVAIGVFVWSKMMQCCRIRHLSIAVASLATLMAVSLYFYRPASADMRLFTWHVTARAAGEKPIVGHGAQSFRAEYMYRQAEFFERNPDAPQAAYIGNNAHVFNEPLKIWFEQGLIGLLLFAALIMSCLIRQKRYSIVHYSLMALIVFSLFSYSSDVYPLKMLFPLLIGITSGRVIFAITRCSDTILLRSTVTACCVSTFFFSVHSWRQDRYISSWIKELYFKNSTQTLTELEKNYDRFYTNQIHMLQYAKVLYVHRHWHEARQALDDLSRLAPSTDVLCDLGTVYQHYGDFDRAERCFSIASSMIPGLLVPKQMLFLLYCDIGDDIRAHQQAIKIIETKEKIVSPTTTAIKKQAMEFLMRSKGEINACEF